MKRLLSIVCSMAAAVPAWAQEPAAADKSGYHLFNPTPRELMRELSADRPDITESPYTVDAGHFQLEMSFVDFVDDREGSRRTQTWTVADTNLKLGLTDSMDVQLVFAAWGEEATHGPGRGSADRGFSDLTVRWKVNLWGNDGGRTALAVMPFVTFPTGTDLSVEEPEAGIIVPLGFEIAPGIAGGLMAEIDAVYDPDDDDYDVAFVHTATAGVDLVGPLGAFGEYVGIVYSDSGSPYEAYFNTGLTYNVSADLILDAGVRIGLNRAAEDIGAFAGMTWRY